MAGAQLQDLDAFGVQKIYPTREGGREWYVDMDDPAADPFLRNLDDLQLSRDSDGSWLVSADQVRMESWSPSNQKWLNVEITEYAKIESGSNELLQLYSRGGHHSDRDECGGSAYKARLYGNGTAAWVKEVTHPAYTDNRGIAQATDQPLQDRWIGFKAVIYNFEEDGQTYVRLESYIDDDVTDSDGNLAIGNNWKLASAVEDRGDWATEDSDFNGSCGRERNEILLEPGGTATENIAGFRTDGIDWKFKYLGVREILPPGEQDLSEPTIPVLDADPMVDSPPEPSEQGSIAVLPEGFLLTSTAYSGDADGTTIEAVSFSARLATTRTHGDIIIAITQGEQVIAVRSIETDSLGTIMQEMQVPFGIEVQDEFQISVLFYGTELAIVDGLELV
ncbi:MAG: hypothetical protein MN733_18360, partial [Nitrososphaera sp.]|nr:hypothetical protein [Nitrososphaera sp.]